MTQVNRKILVLSGKGGVGKSTFAAQLGWAFASDPDVQVRAPFLGQLSGQMNPVLSKRKIITADWNHGCRHMWTFNPYHPRHRI